MNTSAGLWLCKKESRDWKIFAIRQMSCKREQSKVYFNSAERSRHYLKEVLNLEEASSFLGIAKS
ncbi:MAG: hypothetical protein ACI3Y0_11065, partial [Prevotella sp.]